MVAVSPDLQVVTEAGMIRIQVFQEHMRLGLVTIPPFVGELLVGLRVVVTGIAALTYSSTAVDPDTLAVSSLSLHSHVVLLNALQGVVVPHVDAGLYLIQLAFLRVLLDLLPVRLARRVQRLLPELPGSFHTCLLLEAVSRRAVIFLDHLEVCMRVLLLKRRHPRVLLQRDERLDVWGPLFSLLQLPHNILAQGIPGFEVLFGVAFGVVMRD